MKKQSESSLIYTKDKLDNFVLNIEFLLISVVQGVALAALAGASSTIIGEFQMEYWLYVASGFLIIILFWSQAIMHTISFIDWPLDMAHNFLYFLAAFVEVAAFSHMNDPMKWFLFIFLFMLVGFALYIFDYLLIKKHKRDFDVSDAKRALYKHIEMRQRLELRTIIPAGLIFNIASVYLIVVYPDLFLGQNYHLALIAFQVTANILVLLNFLNSFRRRKKMITDCIE